MLIEIRLITTHEEYRAVEELQRRVWNLEDARITPDHVLVTAQKNGGLVLGAFDPLAGEAPCQLVGFVYGLVGLRPDGKVKHCSMQLGVLPGYQNQRVGYRLKLAQREHVLAQGIDLITWTYDPLESRNAYLNMHKLGAVCTTYLRNLYGAMRDRLNTGLPTDRFQVDWHITSQQVATCLAGMHHQLDLGRLREAGAALVPGVASGGAGGHGLTLAPLLPLDAERLLIQVPANFQAIKAADMNLALAWREQTRAVFEAAFGAGYTAVDLLAEGEHRYYLLEKHWRLL